MLQDVMKIFDVFGESIVHDACIISASLRQLVLAYS